MKNQSAEASPRIVVAKQAQFTEPRYVSSALGRAFFLITSVFLLTSAPAHGAEAPLTLADAQRRAVDRSRQTLAQENAAAASHEMAIAARRLPDPILKFGVENLPVNGPDQFSMTGDFMTMRRVGVMQEFTRAEKRELRAERFEHEAEKFRASKAATLATIQRETALAWLDRYYAEAIADVIAQQTKEAKLEIVAVEGAYRGGRGSQADAIAAHGAVLVLEDQASEAGGRIRAAKTALGRWAGEDAANLPLAGRPAIDHLALDTAALDAELAHHPEITILKKQEDIAAADAQIAKADKKVDWSLEVMYSQRGPTYSNMVSVGVSVPLQWDQKQRQDRDLAAKLAVVDQAREEHEEALRMHRAEVGSMVAEWESGRERMVRYEREIIPLAKERTRAALSAYQGGKTAITELLTGRRAEIDARLQGVRIEAQVARLWAQLNFLRPGSELNAHGEMHSGRDRP